MAPELVPKIEEADFFLDKVTCLLSLTPVSNINLKLKEKQRKMFECTCFGHLLEMDEQVFSSQTVHELLLREAKSPNTDEMWFKLGDNRIRFSIQEFCIVTGLNCSPYPSVDVDKKVKGVGLIDSLLNGDMNLYNSTLEDGFMNASSNDDLIMVKLALLYFLENVLLGREKGSPIDSEHILLADDLDRFNEYPWGQVWSYEAIPSLGCKSGHNLGCALPHLFNWKIKRAPNYVELQKIFWQENLQVYAFLQLTPEEEQQCYFQPFIALGASKDQPTLMHDNTTSAASPPSSDVNAITDTMAIKKSEKTKPPIETTVVLEESVVGLKKCKRNRLPSRHQERSQEQGLASLPSSEGIAQSPMPSLDEAQAFFSELKPILDESLENLIQSSLAALDSPQDIFY
ncbi:hypothetical protein EZV62_018927 [Acer yangbiense]|uniref:DUF1985 domain-containing protein n=1 Tax=Acer yangbiense TaxID=1000413 RepID=A0A5C7H9T3_9ROSI|nr:hypothetical protein EZV62_018927 [Acer yangbiense]